MEEFLGGLLGPLLGVGTAVGGTALTKSAYDRLGDIGTQAKTEAETLASQILPMAQFRPFTVTSATGGQFGVTPQVDAQGNVIGTQASLGVSPQEQALQGLLMGQAQQALGGSVYGQPMISQATEQAFGLGGQFMGAAEAQPADVQALRQQYGGLAGQAAMDVLTPTAAREADVYQRIRDTQRPEEERQRLALEERLAQQGRLGVRTAMFGGTPEQLALSKAQEEAQDRASLAAMQQAQSERQQALGTAQTLGGMFGQQATLGSALQAQQAGLGAQYAGLGSALAAQRQALGAAQQQQGLAALGAAYVPQAQMLNVQQAAQLYPQLQQQAQLFGTGQFGETRMTGIEAQLIAEQARANLLGGLGTGLLGGLFNPIGNVEDGVTTGLIEIIKGFGGD
jgi:hypothetical protein